MTGAMLTAVLALGVSTGWQKLPDGGYEYIIQIEPQAVEVLKQEPLTSDLPPGFRNIRSYRIVVGTGPVQKEGNPAEPETPAAPPVLLTTGQTPFAPDPLKKPLAEPATAPAADGSTETPPSDKSSESVPPSKPWLPLSLAVAGLLTSVGGNLYLGWLTWELRDRYRTLLHRSHGSQPA